MEFPEEEQQREVIREIEKAKKLEEEGIRTFVEDRLSIARREREPEIHIRDPHKRRVENYRRIYFEVTQMYADHVIMVENLWNPPEDKRGKNLHGKYATLEDAIKAVTKEANRSLRI